MTLCVLGSLAEHETPEMIEGVIGLQTAELQEKNHRVGNNNFNNRIDGADCMANSKVVSMLTAASDGLILAL